MWHLMLWFSWQGGVCLKDGFYDLGGLFQSYWFHDPMIFTGSWVGLKKNLKPLRWTMPSKTSF